MIVNCDKCGAKFQLADDKITDKGTKVRCSKCKAVFTVKKPDEPAPAPASAAPKPAAPPPKPAAPAAAKADAGKKGDDPFSDFNFSDDLDFGDQEINVKPKAEPDKGFLDSVPSAPIPPKAAAPAAPPADDGGGFDFSDEEFSLSEPEPPKPAAKPAPAPPPKPASPTPPPKPAAKGAEADEFGDFKFDDESFSEPAPAPAPPPPPKPSAARPAAPAPSKSTAAAIKAGGAGVNGGDSEEWGNVSIGEEDAPAGKPKAGAEDIDDTGFGDFKFDDGGGKDDEIDIDSFKRSEKSKAPVRDDLEASIGDGDSESDAPRPAPRKAEATEAPPPPPKPVIKMEKKKSGGSPGWLKFVIIGVVFVCILMGGVGFTNSQGWFTFGDFFTFKWGKIGDIPAINTWLIENGYRKVPNTGAVELVDKPKAEQVTREDLPLPLIVVTGTVANRTNKTRHSIKVQAELKNQNGDVVATAFSYCGVAFTADELKTMGRQGIEDITSMSSGRDMKCMEVEPNAVQPYTIVFFDYPTDGGALKVSNVQVAESKVLGE